MFTHIFQMGWVRTTDQGVRTITSCWVLLSPLVLPSPLGQLVVNGFLSGGKCGGEVIFFFSFVNV